MTTNPNPIGGKAGGFFEIVTTILLVTLSPVLLIYVSYKFSAQTGFALQMNWGAFWIGACILYFIFSFKKIELGSIGVLMLFGKGITNVDSGLKLVPLGIGKIITVPTRRAIFVLGAQTNKQGQVIPLDLETNAGDVILGGKERFFVTFSTKTRASNKRIETSSNDVGYIERVPTKDEWDPGKSDRLEEEQTTSPQVVGVFQISDPLQFVKRFGTMEQAYRILYNLAEGTLQSFAGSRILSFAIRYADDASLLIQRKVEKLIGDPNLFPTDSKESCGVDLVDITVKSWGLSYDLNAEIRNATQAKFTRQVLEETGEGTAKAEELKLLAQAKGRRAMVMAEADGRAAYLKAEADGRKLLLEQAKTTKGMRIAELETLEKAIQGSNTVVAPDFSAVLGLLRAGQATLKGKQPPGSPPTNPGGPVNTQGTGGNP